MKKMAKAKSETQFTDINNLETQAKIEEKEEKRAKRTRQYDIIGELSAGQLFGEISCLTKHLP